MVKNKKDFYAGLMFMAIGGGFALGALKFPMGTAVRMGPAYFPTILGSITLILGLITAIRGFTTTGEDPAPFQWKPMLWIHGSVFLFGLLVDPLHVGFCGAVIAMTIACAYGGYEFSWKEALIESLILLAVCYTAFVYLLGLPFRVFPWS